MTKYLLKRLLTGVLSACAATIIVMIMIFSLLDRNLIFAKDSVYSHQTNNAREAYKYRKWREYGYLDYVTYADYVNSLVRNGRTAEKDSEETQAYIKKFTEYYEGKGYKVVRLDAVLKPSGRGLAEGGSPQLFAHRDIPLISRVLKYFGSIFTVDNIHKASGVADADRGLTFTFYDPVYNPVGSEKKVFSEQIIYIHFILKKMLKFVWSCGIMYASERDNTWLCAFSRLPFTRLCVSARSATR